MRKNLPCTYYHTKQEEKKTVYVPQNLHVSNAKSPSRTQTTKSPSRTNPKKKSGVFHFGGGRDLLWSRFKQPPKEKNNSIQISTTTSSFLFCSTTNDCFALWLVNNKKWSGNIMGSFWHVTNNSFKLAIRHKFVRKTTTTTRAYSNNKKTAVVVGKQNRKWRNKNRRPPPPAA